MTFTPSIITDRQGLDALPIGSRIVTHAAITLIKTDDIEWHDPVDGMDHDTGEIMGDYTEGERAAWLPAMVVGGPEVRKFRISRVITSEKGWSGIFSEAEMREHFPESSWEDPTASHAGHCEDEIDNYQPDWLVALADDDFDHNVTGEVWKVEEL